MAESSHSLEAEADLPPPGRRWGSGAHSVLPYLTRTLQAKPSSGTDPREHKLQDADPRSQRPQA